MNARAFGSGSFHQLPAMPTIIGRTWLDGHDSDPPTLELRLSNGTYVKVGWDSDYSHRLFWFASCATADFVSCTAAATGLSADELGPLEDEVKRAVEAHESNCRAEYEDAYCPEVER